MPKAGGMTTATENGLQANGNPLTANGMHLTQTDTCAQAGSAKEIPGTI